MSARLPIAAAKTSPSVQISNLSTYGKTVPVPEVKDLKELMNDRLMDSCRAGENRTIGQRTETAGAILLLERNHLLSRR